MVTAEDTPVEPMASSPSAPATLAEAPTEHGEQKESKAALKKRLKKEAKAKLKAEHALRPKATSTPPSEPTSVFAEGWLKRVHDSKPAETPIRTRFPPEPNGYLHIGHAKAIAVNFGFAKYYNGICFLRYDDTNPAKEEEKYFTSIREMVEWLGFKPYAITYSSDHFDKLYELAEEMIRRGKGYVCYCTREEVNLGRGGPDNRGARNACVHRDRPIEESLTEFRAMRDGKYKPGEAHLRMKQSLTDPNEGNPQMWDLAAYRVTSETYHHRTGDKWRIYPTYDFTHCLCDAFEEISHSMCTTEFKMSRVSYDWLLEVLDYKLPGSDEKGPMQREYGRLNVEGTILSKRRITMLVDGVTVEKKNEGGTVEMRKIPPTVRGWDDPRLYTLVALRRRGMPARALLDFVESLGVTDALTTISAHRLDNSIRKYLERTVPRLMLILDPVKLIIDDLEEGDEQDLAIPYDPKGQIPGSRSVPYSKTLYIDRADFREVDSPEFFRLAPGKTVGLLSTAFPIKCTTFTKSGDLVTEIRAVKAPGEKPKAYIHWVDAATGTKVIARQYNALFLVEEPNALNWKDGSWADSLNPHSEVVFENAVIEKGLEELRKGHEKQPIGGSDDLVRFQAVRTGYFCIDPEMVDGNPVLNQIVSLKEDKAK